MLKKIISLCLIAFLGACFGGYSPDSNFYRFPSISGMPQVFLSKQKVAIAKVGLPEYLDRPQMVMLDEKSPQMEIAEFDRWGEDLSVMIQRKIAADLSVYLPDAKVNDAQEEVQSANLDVRVEIVRMDMIKQGQAVLQARWYIENTKGKILDSGQFYQTQKIKAKYADYAIAIAKLLEKMDEEIAQAIAKI